MMAARSLAGAAGLAAVLAFGAAGAVRAGALTPAAVPTGLRAAQAQLVCGPYRCFRRPFWRYGPGIGFRPLRRFGVVPVPRYGYRPFGLRRFR